MRRHLFTVLSPKQSGNIRSVSYGPTSGSSGLMYKLCCFWQSWLNNHLYYLSPSTEHDSLVGGGLTLFILLACCHSLTVWGSICWCFSNTTLDYIQPVFMCEVESLLSVSLTNFQSKWLVINIRHKLLRIRLPRLDILRVSAQSYINSYIVV